MALNPLSKDHNKHPSPVNAEGTGVTDITKTLRKIDSTPSHTNSREDNPSKQIPVDLIEEESMESFPASDPPGHHNTRV